MLGLAEHVGRDESWVGRLVGDHQHLGRAGEQIDADAAEQLALGLGHVGVARPDQHVDRWDSLDEAEGHGRQALDAAERQHGVGARRPHRVEHRRVHAAFALRRGAADDALHARGLGHEDRHERRGEHRITAARDVGADRPDGDVPVAENHPRQRFNLEVAQRRPLRAGKGPDLLLGEADVLLEPVAQAR